MAEAAEHNAPAQPLATDEDNHAFLVQPLSFRSDQDTSDSQAFQATLSQTRKLVEGRSSEQGTERAADAVALFFAREVCSSRDATIRRRWTLARCAAACGVSLFELFQELPFRAPALEPLLQQHGLTWATVQANCSIKAWQNTLITIVLLARKCKDLVGRHVHNMGLQSQDAQRLGWLLFLVLKAQLLPPFPDIISCMSLLACVVEVLVAHTPRLSEHALAQTSSAQPAAPVNLLQALCGEAKVDTACATQLAQRVDSLLLHLLPTFVEQWRHEGHQHPAAAMVTTSCSYFNGLLTDESRLQACIEGLDRAYSSLHKQQGEFDEREYLTKECVVPTSPRLSPRPLHNTAKRVHLAAPDWAATAGTSPGTAGGRCNSLLEAVVSPGQYGFMLSASPTSRLGGTSLYARPDARPQLPAAPGAAASGATASGASPQARGTPVSKALAAAAWLRALLGPASTVAQPSEPLQAMLESVLGSAQAAEVLRQAVSLAEEALPNDPVSSTGPGVMGFPSFVPSLTAVRRTDAVRLYFATLQAMLVGGAAGAGTVASTPDAARASLVAVSAGMPFAATSTTAAASVPAATAAGYGMEADGSPRAVGPGPIPHTLHQVAAAPKLLLSSPKFHKALLACCLEVMITAFRITTCSFPCTLERLGLHAFDLLRIMQPFIRYTASLPDELKCHLLGIEERILEALAWQPGSPLHQLLAQPASSPPPSPAQTTPAQTTDARASAAAGQSLSLATARALAAAVSGGPCSICGGSGSSELSACGAGTAATTTTSIAVGVAPGAPEPGSLPGHSGRSPLLSEFLHKVSNLMSFRLALLVDSLAVIPASDHAAVHAAVRRVMEHVLYYHTHLMYNRHIDQIMLCALYGYCRVQRLEHVSFKDILCQYQCQPQATQAVFRHVHLEQSSLELASQSQGQGQADIIAFYNQVFVPAIRPFLLQFQLHPDCGMTGAAAVQAQGLAALMAVRPMQQQQQQQLSLLGRSGRQGITTVPIDTSPSFSNKRRGPDFNQQLLRCESLPMSRGMPQAAGQVCRAALSSDGTTAINSTAFQLIRPGGSASLAQLSPRMDKSSSEATAIEPCSVVTAAALKPISTELLPIPKPEYFMALPAKATRQGKSSNSPKTVPHSPRYSSPKRHDNSNSPKRFNSPRSTPRSPSCKAGSGPIPGDGAGSTRPMPKGLAALLWAVDSTEAQQAAPADGQQQGLEQHHDRSARHAPPGPDVEGGQNIALGPIVDRRVAAGHTSPDSDHTVYFAGGTGHFTRCMPA